MTNVRCLQRKTHLPASHLSVFGQTMRVEPCRGQLRAGLSAIVIAGLLVTLFAGNAGHAADGNYSYGRNAIGTAPSGAAGGEVVDINRDGFGFNARAGHEAGDTVGRDESASLFQLSPYMNIGNGFVFGDSRLTYANEGGLAWSFGGGYRHYVVAWDAVVGGYAYIDRDQITGAHFKQWSVGGEILRDCWEARANWYEPHGNTSTQTATRIDEGSAAFSGQNVLFDRIDTFAEALRGFDAEVGFLLPGKFSERTDLRAFGGGYWYEGVGVPAFTGFSTRLQADIGNWLELALKLTDDEVFHTNVSFNATIHFGGFRSQEHTSRCAIQRMAEPVRRNLNIAATVSDVVAGQQVAMVSDGTGGLRPLIIAHVDSDQAGAGDGTVENPFPTISQGLGTTADIVYTHADSIFTTAPDNQLTLEANKTLLGEGFIPSATGGRETMNVVTLPGIGDLTLPRSPKFVANELRPMMLSSAGTAVTMRTGSKFGGFIIDSPVEHGIFSDTAANLAINDVLIQEAGGNGIRFDSPTGVTSILDTEILSANAGAFLVNGGDATIRYRSSLASGDLDPAFSNIVNDSGPVISIQNTTDGAITFTGVTINDDGGEGIIIAGTPAAPIGGDVTIDNASIINSSGNGISITDAAGQYIFQNTVRTSTFIQASANDAVLIDDLTAAGRVQFADLEISRSGGAGISIIDNAGVISHVGDVSITEPASTQPMISVTGSVAGSTVEYSGGRSLLLDGTAATGGRAGGTGIQLTANEAGSRFSALGDTDILFMGGRGIDIFADDSTITFGGGGANDTLNIQEPGLEGIRIFQTTGPIQFTNGADVARSLATAVPAAAVDIQQSSGLVFFERLQAADSTGNVGVFLQGNTEGPDILAKVSFTTLGIVTDGATALLADGNHEIETRFGTISALTAPAIDISDSGIDMRLEAVNSANSPTFGIRLVDTNKDIDDNRGTLHPTRNKEFSVFGDNFDPGNNTGPSIGSGGTISSATDEGVLLVNAGEVSLFGMNLDNNDWGVRVINDLTDSNGDFRTEDDQFLFVRRGNVIDSNVRGIDTLNLTTLNVLDSLFDNNGDVVTFINGQLANETIYTDYNQLPNDPDTELLSEFDNPFVVNLEGNQFFNDTDDTIFIDQQPEANEAHIVVTTLTNRFEHSESTPTNAFSIIWNGPMSVDLNGDDFTLNGLGEFGATAMSIEAESFTDQTLLTVRNVEITQTDQFQAIGLNVETRAASEISIFNNSFTFQDFNSTGMFFNLGTNTDIAITNNGLFFEQQGGTGIDFNRIGAGSRFLIQDNQILLADQFLINSAIPDDPPREEGIIFGVATGTYTIRGLRNTMFEVFPGNFLNPIAPTFISLPSAGSTIEVNGVNFPITP